MLTRARVGETIEYTVRDRQQDPDDPGKYHLVAVSEKFAFHVRGVYGDDKGQAVALQPVAEPRKMYIAFRGMRTRVEDPEEDRYSAYDRASFANLEPAYADWLPSTSMRVHAGILDHHFCVWNNGLGAFLGSLAARCSDPRQTRLDEILFLGISMGGALSEMSAFRCVSLFPVLRDKVHILSFGSIPWANAPLALSYDEFFGRRSVQLVLCRRAQGPPPEGSTWWVREPASRWALLRSIFTTPQGERHAAPAVTATAAAAAHGAGGVRARQEAGAERYIVFDPLSAKHDDVFILLPNVLACSRDDNQVDARATALLHHARITKQQLRDFVHTYLPEEHPMMVDYNQLHYGGRYRDVLVSMLRRRQAIERSRLHSGVKRGVRGPHGANISTDFIGGPGGTSWGRGAPNAAQLQPGAIIVGGQVIVPEVPLTATGMPKASAPSPSRPVPTAMGCMGPPARPSPAAPSPVAPSPVAPSPAAAEQGGFIRRRAGGLMEGIKEGMREVATRSPKLLRRLTGTLPATAASDAAIVHSSTTAPTTAEPSRLRCLMRVPPPRTQGIQPRRRRVIPMLRPPLGTRRLESTGYPATPCPYRPSIQDAETRQNSMQRPRLLRAQHQHRALVQPALPLPLSAPQLPLTSRRACLWPLRRVQQRRNVRLLHSHVACLGSSDRQRRLPRPRHFLGARRVAAWCELAQRQGRRWWHNGNRLPTIQKRSRMPRRQQWLRRPWSSSLRARRALRRQPLPWPLLAARRCLQYRLGSPRLPAGRRLSPRPQHSVLTASGVSGRVQRPPFHCAVAARVRIVAASSPAAC